MRGNLANFGQKARFSENLGKFLENKGKFFLKLSIFVDNSQSLGQLPRSCPVVQGSGQLPIFGQLLPLYVIRLLSEFL